MAWKRVEAPKRVSRDPGRTGSYEYRGAKIWVSGPVGGTWWATVKFRSQEKDLDARTLEAVLEAARDWIDNAPELHTPNAKVEKFGSSASIDRRVTEGGLEYERARDGRWEIFEDGIMLGRVTDPEQVERLETMAHGYAQNPMRLDSKWSVGDTGAEYEFKVKLGMRVRGVNISDDELYVETEMAVNIFADELRGAYPWVGRVGLTGRSGGWLLVEDKLGKATEDELSDINDRVDEARKDFETALIDTFGYTENSSRGGDSSELVTALEAFKRAGFRLDEAWEKSGEDLSHLYPFSKDFGDVTAEIDRWVRESKKDLGYAENSSYEPPRGASSGPPWPVDAAERSDLALAVGEAGYGGQKAAHVVRELNWWRKRHQET